MKRILFILTIMLGVTLTTLGETEDEIIIRIYNTANEMENVGRYSEALAYYKQVYELGERTLSPMKISEFYALGKGVPENFVESDRWLRIAANYGNAQAQNMVGDIYYYGMGVAKNLPESAKWYLKSAEQGYSDAQFKIALAYLDGEGVAQNNQLGLSWLRKAAENNHPDAQDAMAIIYGYGKNGVQKDEKEFVKWAFEPLPMVVLLLNTEQE